MDESLMPPEEREARAHVVVPEAGQEPETEAGRLMHRMWHREYLPLVTDSSAAQTCGSRGCTFLGRVLAIEWEMRERPADDMEGPSMHGLGVEG